MKRDDRRWLWTLAGGLLVASVVIYVIQISIFHTPGSTFFYIFQDLAFLPLTVLLVGLVIERFISLREKRALVHKLNMVIGTFFSELGTPLLAELLPTMKAAPEISENLHLTAAWKNEDFARASGFARGLQCEVDLGQIDRAALQEHLLSHRQFLLRLLENPNLMEHEAFTDVLWAVVHLTEELAARDLTQPPPVADARHLGGDIQRAFERTTAAWLEYMRHLQKAYPYLFSLAARQNPFDPDASVVVRQ